MAVIGTNIRGTFPTNMPSVSQFGGMNIKEDLLEHSHFSVDKMSPINSRVFSNENNSIENRLLLRSRNNSNEKPSVKPTPNKKYDDQTSTQSTEINMIVETDEGHHQPDLSEIIRSLDTPPPS